MKGTGGVVLRCDSRGVIQQVLLEGLGVGAEDAVGTSFQDLVVRRDQAVALSFLVELRTRGWAQGWEMELGRHGTSVPLHVSGATLGEDLVIAGSRTARDAYVLLQSVAEVSSSAADLPGSTAAPHFSSEEPRSSADLYLLDEVSRLNNDLSTAQRELAKQHAIARREARDWQAIFDAVEDGICLLDEQSRIRRCNRRAAEMLEQDASTLVGAPVRERMPWAGSLLEDSPGERSSSEAGRRSAEFPLENRWLHLSIDPIVDEEGRTAGAILLFSDITQRKHLEEGLYQARKLEAVGRIAAQVAHDFNNLLGPLTGYPALIKMSLPADSDARGYCDEIEEAARGMAEIASDMWLLGRGGLLQQEPVDLNLVVRRVAGLLQSAPASLVVTLDLASNLRLIVGSPAELTRVLLSLVSNARDAMQDRGMLTMATRNVELVHPIEGREQVPPGLYVHLQVADTGPGIPQHLQDKIFDPFFSTKSRSTQRGTGLALALVRSIVHDHRAFIDFESGVGSGTSFSLYFPVSKELGPGSKAASQPRRRRRA